MKNDYYTYAYLRKDGTPYYIGKGRRYRAFDGANHAIKLPPKERIIFLKKNLTEEEAFKHEIYLIAVLGRKDLGTGILRNITDGGEGASGWVVSEETRKKFREQNLGRKKSEETRRKLSASLRGKKQSEEWIKKRADALRGKPKSEAHRANILKAQRKRRERERKEKELAGR